MWAARSEYLTSLKVSWPDQYSEEVSYTVFLREDKSRLSRDELHKVRTTKLFVGAQWLSGRVLDSCAPYDS